MGEPAVSVSVPVVSTRLPELDVALGVGGWPVGRLIELRGPGPQVDRLVEATARGVSRVVWVPAGPVEEMLQTCLHTAERVRALVIVPQIVGATERQLTRLCRQVLPVLTRSRATMLYCGGPLRSESSVLVPRTEPNALKFYASVRVHLTGPLDGITTCRVVKNKLAPPFTTALVRLGEAPESPEAPEPWGAADTAGWYDLTTSRLPEETP